MWQIRTGRVETPFDGGVPFWMISLIAHLVLILLVATWIVPGIDRSLVSFSASTEPLELIEDVAPDVEFEDMMTEVSGEISETDVSLEAAEEAMSSVDIENDSSQPDLDLDFSDVGTFETGLDGLDGGAEAFAEIATKGEAGTAVAGASGAVDRISEEIIQSLEDNKTLVVWLFDQSGSLLEQRTRIMKRLDKVYNNDLAATGLLGDLDQAQLQNQRLLTDVIAFGNKITPMLKNRRLTTTKLAKRSEKLNSTPPASKESWRPLRRRPINTNGCTRLIRRLRSGNATCVSLLFPTKLATTATKPTRPSRSAAKTKSPFT